MRPLTRLVLAATALVIAASSTPALANGLDYDHLKCFKIRDSLVERRTIYLADLYPNGPFGTRKDCRLRLPALHFCINVHKDNVLVGDEPFDTIEVPGAEEARDYLCYDVKCDRDRLEVGALDQFGARTIRTRKSDFLCMPASKVVDETPTPTPTPTPEPDGCMFENDGVLGPQCGGPCPSGDICVYDDQQRDCECVSKTTLCDFRPIGTGSGGMCGGFCFGPDDVCVEGRGARGEIECECQPISIPACGMEQPTARGPGFGVCGGPCPIGQTCVFSDAPQNDGCECRPDDELCGDAGEETCGGWCPGESQRCSDDRARPVLNCMCEEL